MVKTTDSASNALWDVLKVLLWVSKVLDASKSMPPAHGGDSLGAQYCSLKGKRTERLDI